MPLFVAYHGLDAASHQLRVNELGPQGYRPVSLSVSGDPSEARYAAVWVQRPGAGWSAVHGLSAAEYQTKFDALIGEWWARHGVTAGEYQAEFDTRVSAGLMPIVVQAGGTGDRARYASIFARTEFPKPRVWTVTGMSDPRLTGLDEVVRQFMAAHAVTLHPNAFPELDLGLIYLATYGFSGSTGGENGRARSSVYSAP